MKYYDSGFITDGIDGESPFRIPFFFWWNLSLRVHRASLPDNCTNFVLSRKNHDALTNLNIIGEKFLSWEIVIDFFAKSIIQSFSFSCFTFGFF